MNPFELIPRFILWVFFIAGMGLVVSGIIAIIIRTGHVLDQVKKSCDEITASLETER